MPNKTLSKLRDVLRYSMPGAHRSTLRRHYLRWRSEQAPQIPVRCDNPDCSFYLRPLDWNSKPLPLILDHINGNNSDNRPDNLRFLCPNCDSQLDTRGGGNKGRIEKDEGGFVVISRSRRRDYILPAESGSFSVTGTDAQLSTAQPLSSADETEDQ